MTRLKYAAALTGVVALRVAKLTGIALAVIFAGFVYVTVGLMAWLIRDSFTGRY